MFDNRAAKYFERVTIAPEGAVEAWEEAEKEKPKPAKLADDYDSIGAVLRDLELRR